MKLYTGGERASVLASLACEQHYAATTLYSLSSRLLDAMELVVTPCLVPRSPRLPLVAPGSVPLSIVAYRLGLALSAP